MKLYGKNVCWSFCCVSLTVWRFTPPYRTAWPPACQRSCWRLFWSTSDCCCHKALPASHNVLPSVVATCPAHTQAPQPSVVVQSLNVHGLLPAQFPLGTETLHNLCLGLPGSSVPHLLQLLGELLLVSLHRIPVARIGSRSQHSGHLENNNLPVCWGLLFCFKKGGGLGRRGGGVRHVTGVKTACFL